MVEKCPSGHSSARHSWTIFLSGKSSNVFPVAQPSKVVNAPPTLRSIFASPFVKDACFSESIHSSKMSCGEPGRTISWVMVAVFMSRLFCGFPSFSADIKRRSFSHSVAALFLLFLCHEAFFRIRKFAIDRQTADAEVAQRPGRCLQFRR